jgi:tetratricopeptide (TPR) repeat protein
MNTLFCLLVSLMCGGWIFCPPVFAGPANQLPPPATDMTTQSVVNGYLQIQAQLHDAQLAIDDSRAESKHTADALTARIQSLEDALATQRANEVAMAQKNQQFTMLLAVGFGLLVVAAVLFMAYLQWRAVARLVELTALRPPEFSARVASPLVSSVAVEQSNARLSGAVELLQKKILELEHSARAPLAGKTPAATNGSHKKPDPKNANLTASDRAECVANLLTEGQSLLDAQQPEKALECFEVALGLEPKHAEALVKKGGALEKLGRNDEAIVCYDRAIAADGSLTIALLHKGGLFNRLARYDEALQCYEQALRTQEKKMPEEKIAA